MFPPSTDFPPEPWQLGGSMLATVWRVDPREVRAQVAPFLPDGVEPVTLGGRAFLMTAFVRYEPGSVVSYDELLVAVVARRGLKPVTTIPQIWVDSPTSVAGGRALWGIPKHLASFDQTWSRTITGTATADGTRLASVRATQGLRLPGWRRVPLPNGHRLDGRTTFAEVQALGRLHLARAHWEIPADSPLAWITRGEPSVSLALRDMTIRFGPSVRVGS